MGERRRVFQKLFMQGDFDLVSWMQGPAVSTGRIKRAAATKVLKNPVFLLYATCTKDQYWVTKMTDAAYDKFPRGFKYNTDIKANLTYQKGQNTITEPLSGDFGTQTVNGPIVNDNVVRDFARVMEFFKVYGACYSALDKQRSDEDSINLEPVQFMWSEINGNTRIGMIAEYVKVQKRLLQLSQVEATEMYQVLYQGAMTDKVFGKHNIILCENFIDAVPGLIMDTMENGRRHFRPDPSLKPKSIKHSKESEMIEVKAVDINREWRERITRLVSCYNKCYGAGAAKVPEADTASLTSTLMSPRSSSGGLLSPSSRLLSPGGAYFV